jgi:23S rRNA (uracil1939-C5)-methyltransferase
VTPGTAFELSISRLVAGGDGLGFVDGKAVFVPGTLPGERVRARVAQSRRDFDRAVLVQVLEPSPHRVDPGCRFAGVCGGCDWLHVDYDEQLRQKAAIVSEALRRTGRIERPVPPIEASEPWRSRNRAQVHCAEQGGLGYMGARSAHVVTVDACPIVTTSIERLFRGEAVPPKGLDRFTVFGAGEMLAVEGRDDGRDLAVEVNGRRILFSVGCFFQSNLGMLGKLVSWALDGLQGGTAADLYCGVGLFGAFLAGAFSRVVCVESSAMSLSYARRNVPGPDNEFHPMSVEQWISAGSGPAAARDLVLVDPPRAGLGPEVRQWLVRAPAAKLVYVSCNPVTLARDLGELTADGYSLEDLRLFDFYPQTSHVEAVARLSAR